MEISRDVAICIDALLGISTLSVVEKVSGETRPRECVCCVFYGIPLPMEFSVELVLLVNFIQDNVIAVK